MNRKNKAKIRKKARKKLPQLLSSQKNQCYWCKCHIVSRTDMRIIPNTENKQRVSIFERGTISIVPLATVDHIVPLRDSINNHISNLVASCFDCNWKRTRQKSKKSKKCKKYLCKCGSGFYRRKKNRQKCVVCSLYVPIKSKWFFIYRIESILDKVRNLQYDT